MYVSFYFLRWGDIQLETGSDGIEYLRLQERQTKTRTGSNVHDVRQITPKIFATADDPERCPVGMYKLYKSKRPQTFCEPDHPFYIAPRTSSQTIDNNTWFMKIKLGEKKLGSLLKIMAADGGLDESKRLTNHSTRKHLVQKLRDSGIAPTDIMQISGHKNIQSVMNYSAMSEEKHKQCSRILSTVRPSSDRPSSSASSSSVSDGVFPAIAQPCQSASHSLPFVQSVPVSSASSSTSSCTLSHDVSPPNPEPRSDYEIETVNISNHKVRAQEYQNDQSRPNVHVPVPVPDPCPVSSNSTGNSISVVNDTVTLNTQMNSLFSGAVLNIQNFNMFMK
ncbi:uncharacterized protein LOC128555440 [Mercenaria mercenaria]|uniref:uncharacterized protein LOC128555440 n=1 Tax=Mercenaria mercenaria TaxID=6596 RepID=UPI00234ECC48|nr:uncharacterized protein LOC128555440 [Mercenaria mercenaria]